MNVCKISAGTILVLLGGSTLTIHAQDKMVQISDIGSPITVEVATNAINQFKTQYKVSIYEHRFAKKALTELLNLSDLAGLSMFNGLDSYGHSKLIIRAISNDGTFIQHGGAYDGTGKIEEHVAQQWIANFENTYKERPRAHVIGKFALMAMLNGDKVVALSFNYGLDNNGVEHLIYAAIDDHGRWLKEPGGGTIPCLPYCPNQQPKSHERALKN